MAKKAAQNIATDASNDIDEEKSRCPVNLFNLWPKVHQHPHIEHNVHQAAMEKHCHDKPPRLSKVVRKRERRAKSLQHVATNRTKTHQCRESATARWLKTVCANRGQEADDV